jgi:phosphohistidine phosphatase
MASLLWLLRHGEAVPHGSEPEDADRALTPNGVHQSRTAGQALARAGVEIEACYASPKVRARDTARLAGEELGVEVAEAPEIAAGFDADAARALAGAHDGDVLVVGHDPDFTQVVHDLTGARVDFKKGGVAAIRLGPLPELLALLRPAELIAMAGERR